MKKFFIAAVVLLMFSLIANAQEKVLFATGEWAPYVSESLPEKGASAELVSAICKAGGIQAEFQFYPWARAEKMVSAGEVFGAFPYAVTEERKKNYEFSDAMYYGVNKFWYYNKNPKTSKPITFEKMEDLKGYTIGVLNGSFLQTELAKYGIKVEATSNVEQSIQKLQMGRIDFYIDEMVPTYDMIKKVFPKEVDNFKTLPKMYGDKAPQAILVSRKYKGSQEILKKFNDGLKKIKASGEYDRITNKYNMTK